ncbi:hypothetical protein [Bradyrhizobium sp. CCBAU 53380]|uniref:hypothetical protein n=1 Tax=Bradyrhizobium sp. CCBAU 53380 TaxID=1325117 RepID=UPI002304CB4A|nr:hypothetical protein [Bradyrhizobium sp. CCBAU 53380]MDA9420974.1 hypothetical protein [Bradyrhizobium sp. CCBAU 53380]
MKLYEAFQDTGFHTTIMTTFCVEFDAFESIVLSRLRGADCRNVMLVCDANMAGLALADGVNPPKSAGNNYLLAKARVEGVFHPKVIVQIGKNRGRLIVASANATASGLAGNLEISAAVECGAEESPERQLVLAGWHYAVRFLDRRQQAVEDKLRWARDRSPWLAVEANPGSIVQLPDGTSAAFLAADAQAGLARQFADLVGRQRPVDRLAVLSPYWDEDLSGLDTLRSLLRPKKTVLLIDAQEKAFPAGALPRKAPIQVSDLRGFSRTHMPENSSRFVHAKMIVATIGRVDHVLEGSANCTFAALGAITRPGINAEACLYRRLPGGVVFDAMELGPLLKASRALKPGDIPKMRKLERLPLGEMEARDPGTFELVYDTLHWWPSTDAMKAAFDRGRCLIELLDANCRPIGARLDSLPNPQASSKFRLAQCDSAPVFARFRHHDGMLSSLAVIARVQELQTQTRDPLTAGAERAIRELEMDDDEGLWLLDVIQRLSVPKAEGSVVPNAARLGAVKKPDKERQTGQLGYEEFMRGRRRDIKPTEAERNALSGSHASFVRAALNRMLGLGSTTEGEAGEISEEQAVEAIDTGDETAGNADALEEGFDPGAPKPSKPSPKTALELARRRREADVAAIVAAVDDYTEDLREPNRRFDEIDVLRLRAMMMIIVVAGWPGPGDPAYKPSQAQVLPCHHPTKGETWPRQIGRVLLPVFTGVDPAFGRLLFDRGHDRLTDDLLETLACCVWAANAAAMATKLNPACAKLAPMLAGLASKIATYLGLSREEMRAPAFADVIESLDQRFGKRLQIPTLASAILAMPRSAVSAAT